MFEKRSKVLFVCAILVTLYIIYLITYFAGATASEDDIEAIGGAIATALVIPHMMVMALGAIFSWLGFGLKKTWGALVGAILYCVGLVLFPLYFMFTIPLIILGFVGYSNEKKLLSI
ncbi:MAG: hypothetical protein HFH45_00155 [Bacilli bacterium]|nr:hypothetical protein [Bacilli bacterium]